MEVFDMIDRPKYVDRIMAYVDTPFVKILTGVRRCGKTEILRMIMGELSRMVPAEDITYISFELLENHRLRSATALYEHLGGKLASGKRHYVMLDEIQFVEDWPEVVNSIKTKFRNAWRKDAMAYRFQSSLTICRPFQSHALPRSSSALT